MGQRWICTNGHSTREAPARLRCPVCSAPVTQVVPVGAAAGGVDSLDQTLVPPPSAAPPARPEPTQPPANGNGPHGPATEIDRPTPLSAVPLLGRPPSAAPAPHEETLAPAASAAPLTGRPTPAPTNPVSPITPPINDAPTLVPSEGAPSQPARPAAPSRIAVPDYEILEVLGRGGMGVVYKARQTRLNRLVALKMVLAGLHASSEDLRRFQTEAEAVARLQHPNIVQVFEHGERDGRPFFSLEYCAGGSLQSRLDGTPLAPTTAARLIRALAEAVHYAHQQGVVHRDLKPANVLIVEPRGTALESCTPKLTDFGLAKMLDNEGHTATEAVLGTPTYMAPEQAQGKTKEVGPAADIYSLGAILYDVLVGRPPFKGATVMDTIQMVQTAEPVPPKRLQPGIPVDLQTITLKCLEKSPARRYATAAELADDLGRFLHGEPIKARPVSALEHAWKWVVRNPALAALIALCFLAPLAIAAVSVYFTVQLRDALETTDQAKKQAEAEKRTAESATLKAEAEKRTAEAEKRRAESATRRAEDEKARVEKAQDELQISFRNAQQATESMLRLAQSRLRYLGGTEEVRRELLKAALKMSLSFTERQGGSVANLMRAAHAHHLVGDLEYQLGEHPKAIEQFNKALGALDDVIKMDGKYRQDVDLQNERVELLLRRWAAEQASAPGPATSTLDEAISLLGHVGRGVKQHWKTRRTLASVHSVKGIHEQGLGPLRLRAARADLATALGILNGLEADSQVAQEPAHLNGVRLEKARALCNLSALDTALGAQAWGGEQRRRALGRALAEANESLAILNDLRKRSSAVDVLSELGRAVGNKGMVLLALGERDKAVEVLNEAVREFREVRKAAPLNADYRHLLGVVLLNQGAVLLNLGQPLAAVKPLREAKGLLDGLVKDHPRSSIYLNDASSAALAIGQVLVRAGKTSAAVPNFEKALAGFREAAARRNLPEGSEARKAWKALVHAHHALASAADAAGDTKTALAHLGPLVQLRRERVKAFRPASGDWWRTLEAVLAGVDLLLTQGVRARLLEKAGDHHAAYEAIKEMADLSPTWPEHVESLVRLAGCVRLAGADSAATPEQRARWKDEYGGLALRLLEGLAKRHPARLKGRLSSPALAPLRELPTVAMAMAEIEKRGGR